MTFINSNKMEKFLLILLAVIFKCTSKKISCTTSGHVCRSSMLGACSSKKAFLEDPCFTHFGNKSLESGYISPHCDYCPEAYPVPEDGPSIQPGIYPCRSEDGFYRCPKHPDDNCIRRSVVNRLSSPSGACKDSNSFLGITCSDDELSCKTHNRCVERHEINTMFGCEYQVHSILIECHQNEFKCKLSERCIPRKWVKDGSVDCSLHEDYLNDTSDEDEPLESCDSTTEFRCHDKTLRCIPRDMVMNGMKDCLNGSDEDQALDCNDQNEFRCSVNGRCIPRYRVNDGFADCINATDENLPHFDCNLHKEFECVGEHRCIPRSWVGNSLFDCKSGIDEEEQLRNCTEDEFACEDGSRCLPRKYLCDGVKNCADCSDEIELCDEPRRFRCSNDTSVCIPWAYTCDGTRDCTDGSDERTNELSGFKCVVSRSKCFVPQFTLTNNFAFCPDKSDRCYDNKGNFQCARCLDNKTIISPKQLCDGFIDCPDLSDECCCEETKAEPICQLVYPLLHIQHDCAETLLGNHSLVCDDVIDCRDAIDERFCHDDVRVDVSSQYTCRSIVQEKRFRFKYDVSATFCDGKLECPFRDDECSPNCSYRSTFCSRNHTGDQPCLINRLPNAIKSSEICDGVKQCDNGVDESDCPSIFWCKTAVRLSGTLPKYVGDSVNMSQRCDLIIDCLDQSDEIGCPEKTHFYCKEGTKLFVNRSQVFDGVFDCDDNSDECGEEINDSFASSNQMIAQILIRTYVWIIGLLSSLANTWVIFYSIRELKNCKIRNSVAYCNRLFVAHVATADLLMGLALLVIGTMALRFGGQYCFYHFQWRVSNTCNSIGMLTLTSTLVTVNLLTALTILRLIVVLRPFNTSKITARHCWIVVTVIWAQALFVSILPIVAKSYFSNSVLISGNKLYFKASNVSVTSLNRYTSRTNQIIAANNYQWNTGRKSFVFFDAASRIRFPTRYLFIDGMFSYYSFYGICFPDVFVSYTRNQIYSLTITMYNTTALLVIIICYVIIYRKSLNRRVGESSQCYGEEATREKQTLKRRISLLVMTNALCWFPICTLAILSFTAYRLPPEIYAKIAIFLLPINSILNPIIYSRFHRHLYVAIHSFGTRKKIFSRSPCLEQTNESTSV